MNSLAECRFHSNDITRPGRARRFFGFATGLATLIFLTLCLIGRAFAESTSEAPPKPERYFNDYASLVRPQTAQALNQRLENLERESSNQILVVIYKTLPEGTTVEDFAQTAFRAWRPGQKGRNNGAILFVFLRDRKAWIQTGYGLEGALPDAICRRIVANELAPRFQTGDFDGGLTAAVDAMIAATKGEYKGTGKTVSQARRNREAAGGNMVELIFVLVVFGLIAFSFIRNLRRGTIYTSGGFFPGGTMGGGGGFTTGGGGGSGGNDGGGFSGGGGDSGGGGAGGSW